MELRTTVHMSVALANSLDYSIHIFHIYKAQNRSSSIKPIAGPTCDRWMDGCVRARAAGAWREWSIYSTCTYTDNVGVPTFMDVGGKKSTFCIS